MANSLYKSQAATMVAPPPVPPLTSVTQFRTYSELTAVPVYDVIDTVTGQVVGRFPVPTGTQLSGVIRGVAQREQLFDVWGRGRITSLVSEDYVAFLRYEFVGFEYTRTLKTERIVYDVPARPVDRTPRVTPVVNAWDSSAWSLDSRYGNIRVKFKVPGGAQSSVLVGLADQTPKPGDLGAIAHGFKVEAGRAYVHIARQPGVEPWAAPTNYFKTHADVVADDELAVSVQANVVSYTHNGELVATVPLHLSGLRAVHLASMLYSPESVVSDPVVEDFVRGGYGELVLGVKVVGSESPYSQGTLILPLVIRGATRGGGLRFGLRIQGSGRAVANTGVLAVPGVFTFNCWGFAGVAGSGALVLPAIQAVGGESGYSQGKTVLRAFATGSGREPRYTNDSLAFGLDEWVADLASFPHRSLAASAAGSTTFRATYVPSDRLRQQAIGAGTFRASLSWLVEMLARASVRDAFAAERVLDVLLVGGADVSSPLTGVLILSETLPAQTTVGSVLVGNTLKDATTSATASAADQYTVQQALDAIFGARVHAGVAMGLPGKTRSVWAVNLASGSTAYEDYPFNSFARIGDRYYGASEDGLYELVGDDDAGTPIHASVNLGKQSFGSSYLKNINYAYLGVKSDGRMVVRVTTPEGASYLYQTRDSKDAVATQRADFGRGLRATYLGLEIYNQDGGDFTLDKIEFAVAEMKRRI